MIDTHIHFWRYIPADYVWISDEMPELKQDRLPEHIAPQARVFGVEAAVAVQARCDEAENGFLLSLAERNEWVAGVVGWLDFTAANVRERLADYATQHLMKGFRHLVQDEPDPSAFWMRRDFREGVAAAHKAGFSYDLLCRQTDLSAVLEFARYCDNGWLVLDHLGKPDFRQPESFKKWRNNLTELARLPHVVVKVSGLVTEFGQGAAGGDMLQHVETALELFGAERVMWGSDWPVCTLTGHGYEELHNHWQIFAAGLSDAERLLAEKENAQRVYCL